MSTITKKILAELREEAKEPLPIVGPQVLLALLDEREAMLAAVKDIATAFRARADLRMFPGHPEASVYLAAARDLEGHPAFGGAKEDEV